MRRSFDSYLGKTLAYNELPEKIEEEELLNLVLLLQAGDISVSHAIINGHMRLAMATVSDFANPRRSDDLVGEALLRLVECVGWCAGPNSRLHDTNITPYLGYNMRAAVRQYIEKDSVIGMKGRTKRHKIATGELSWEQDTDQGAVYSIDSLDSDILPFDYNTPIARREEPDLELTEILQLAIQTEGERRIITLRAQGYKHTEIAPIVGLSIRRVGQLNADVESRFNALCG